MTRRSKPKPKRTAPDNRERTHPFQAYLSDEEWTEFERKAAAKGCTRTELFRAMIMAPTKKTAKRKPRPKASAPVVLPIDPRQVDFTELEVFNAAVLQFAGQEASAS